MAKHQLALEIPEVNNPTFIKIFDASDYVEGLPVECSTLHISVPGFTEEISLIIDPNFNTTITACKLGIQLKDCNSSAQNLPDGIYSIGYSISPSDIQRVEYDYFRMTKTLSRYYEALASFGIGSCDPCEELQYQFSELRLIKSLLDIAKAKVEVQCDTAEGMDIFRYAQKRLEKYFKTCGF